MHLFFCYVKNQFLKNSKKRGIIANYTSYLFIVTQSNKNVKRKKLEEVYYERYYFN